jgi:hypothetical protein
MQMNHILTAGPLMKIINVLGDHSQLGHMLGKLAPIKEVVPHREFGLHHHHPILRS